MTECVFIRSDVFYIIDLREGDVGRTLEQCAADNAACNPGTVRVETIDGRVLWPLPPPPAPKTEKDE